MELFWLGLTFIVRLRKKIRELKEKEEIEMA